MAALEAYYTGMARTYRTPDSARRSYYSCEAKPARKETGRKIRNATRQALRRGDFDNLPRHRGTEGRITH